MISTLTIDKLGRIVLPKAVNLTLLRLSGAVEVPELAAEIESLVEQAEKAARFARDWRNRRLAHTDLKLALEDRAESLPGVSRYNVEQALAATAAVLNRIQGHFSPPEVAFQLFIAHDDAESLAYYLKSAIDAEDHEQELELRGRS